VCTKSFATENNNSLTCPSNVLKIVCIVMHVQKGYVIPEGLKAEELGSFTKGS